MRYFSVLVAVLLWLSASALAEDRYENFRSEARSVTPAVSGLELIVVGGDEQLELRNDTGEIVVVEGYDEEPYLRFKPDGTVERNERSPATYLNADRQGLRSVPASAKPNASPSWKAVSDDGSYRWFDHRIHVTETAIPKRFREATARKKVFDWEIPASVADKPVRAQGTLFYDPAASTAADADESDGGAPIGLIVGGAAAGVLALAALLAMLRRRGGGPPRERRTEEAW